MDLNFLFIIFSFIFGALFGSFLNVIILRLPKEQKLGGRSHCPSCKHVLGFLDLVPLLSFLFLGGKCRYCGKKISIRYFAIEGITGMLFLFAFWQISPINLESWLTLLKVFAIIMTLIAVFVIDYEHFLILDSVLLPSGILVLIINIILDSLAYGQPLARFGLTVSSLTAALVSAAPFFAIWLFSKGQYMGFGDVKFALWLGIVAGWPLSFVSLFLAVVIGGLFSAILLMFTSKTLKSRLPFGCFLAIGAFISIFYGQAILAWYLAFTGI